MASLTGKRAIGILGTAAALTLGLSVAGSAQIIVPGYPYGYRYAAADASVKFDVKPNEAAVYVDGYYAGLVDDYDGAFQRLRTAPGGHEITIFLEGYRTYSERVYLSADNTFKLKHRMEKLAGGEASARPPAPQPPQYQAAQPADGQQPPQPRGPFGRRGPRGFPPNGPDTLAPPPPSGNPGGPAGPPAVQSDANNGRGTLALTIQPGDADVLVDGTPWRNDGAGRQAIDLSEGRHNIQIRKTGYVGYLTDVQIRRGETTPLDVQLKTQPR